MPAEDMNRRKDRVLNEAKKVVENINAMSFLNLDDQQVHSLMMMREIARGIVNNKVAKVTKSDVKKALSCSIEKMVGSCKDVNSILSRIPCEGMDDEQTQSVSRMKEIASTIVTRRAKVTSSRLLLEPAYRSTEDTVESKMVLTTSNNDMDIGGIQRRLFEVEGEPTTIEYGQSEGQDVVMADTLHAENGSVQVGVELGTAVVDGASAVGNEVQIAQTEGLMFDDVELVVETEVRDEEDDQKEKQEIVNGTSEERNEAGQNKARKLALVSPLRLSVTWPLDGKITLEWVKDMMAKFELSSKKDPPSEFWTLMASDVVDKLITSASSILSKEPNCVEVDCHEEGSTVVVVGDVEGQFHDLLNIFRIAGLPSENQFYVFNGNYVDRGAWGLEAFLVLLALKVLMPDRVYLLRGNHETKFCTTIYGFEQEVKTKFGEEGEMVYQKCLECFKELPLASIISKTVYTTHGGLFRSMHAGPLRRSKRKRAQNLDLGSLEDLSKVDRSLIDAPDGGSSILADILWSDPSKDDGLVENTDKQRGLSWGPDCTEAFLKESNLKLIIRSHQSPDGRAGQDDFGNLLSGYSEDHVGESGKLYTLFSAPDYPQFGEPKYNNEGAYAVLKAPNFENPSFHSFKGVRPPKLTAYGSSSSQTSCPAWMLSKVDFEAFGISNPPSWSVPLPDNAGGTKLVEVLRAPAVEGIPLPSELQEPHKSAFEYLFELVAGLKYMLSTRAIESRAAESAMEASVLDENKGQTIPNENEEECLPDENEGENIPDGKEGESMAIDMEGCEGQNIPDGGEAQDVVATANEGLDISSEGQAVQETLTDKEGQEILPEKEGESGPTETGEQDVPAQKEGQEDVAAKTEKEKEEEEKEKEKPVTDEVTDKEKEKEEMVTDEVTDKEEEKEETVTEEEEKEETVTEEQETEKEKEKEETVTEEEDTEKEKEKEETVAVEEETEKEKEKEETVTEEEETEKEKEKEETEKEKEETEKEKEKEETEKEKKEEAEKEKEETVIEKEKEKETAMEEAKPETEIKKKEEEKEKETVTEEAKPETETKKKGKEKEKEAKPEAETKEKEKEKEKEEAKCKTESKKKEKENEKEKETEKKEKVTKNEKEKEKKEKQNVPSEKEAQRAADAKKGHDLPKAKEEKKKEESNQNEKEGKKTTNKRGGKRILDEDDKNDEPMTPSENKAKKHKAEPKARE